MAKFKVFAFTPDIYGRVTWGVSDGITMSANGYPSKFAAELVCAGWNGDVDILAQAAADFEDFLQAFCDADNEEKIGKLREKAQKILNRE